MVYAVGIVVAIVIGVILGFVCSREEGVKMLNVIKKRIANLVEFITSKKVIVGSLAAAFVIYATDLAKIIAIGSIAVVYIIAQGLIDIQKAKK